VLAHSIAAALDFGAEAHPAVELVSLLLTHPPAHGEPTRQVMEEVLRADRCLAPGFQARCLAGGATRQESVRLALEALPADLDAVFVHDGVRPLATAALYHRLWEALRREDQAVGAVPLRVSDDTLKEVEAGGGCLRVARTVDRERVVAVQTPQLFRWPDLLEWHRLAARDGFTGTDDASLAERHAPGRTVLAVEGGRRNLKITRREDLAMAECWLREDKDSGPGLRVGQGFDVHAFADGPPLVLGGVPLPGERGLAGHSDADVLLHAITDALLGGAALGDIGSHFPDADEQWRGADSWDLLREAGQRVRAAGLRPVNVDATVICERPKVRPHVGAMRVRIAAALDLAVECVNVKGTTTEGLGFTGRGEGIAAQAVVLLSPAAPDKI
jgi:2-C-methyl-D-erythritol 2,4-cyclodiphosphate synthase/2-C-methyl-D-erythritol 4-phosphate cytidylyltransferase